MNDWNIIGTYSLPDWDIRESMGNFETKNGADLDAQKDHTTR